MNPEDFKKRIITKYPSGVASDGTKYADMDATELTRRMVEKYPDGVTSDGIPYKNFLQNKPAQETKEDLGWNPQAGFYADLDKNKKQSAQERAQQLYQELKPIMPADANDNILQLGGKAVVNIPSGVWNLAKGIFSTIVHPIQTTKAVVNNPQLLLGPAVEQTTKGIMTTVDKGVDVALGKAKPGEVLSTAQEEFQKAAIAFVDDPLNSILAVSALGKGAKGAKGIVTEPVKTAKGAVGSVKETAGKALDTTKAVGGAILSPVETAKKGVSMARDAYSSFVDKSNLYWTKRGVSEQIAQTLDNIDKSNTDFLGERQALFDELKSLNQVEPTYQAKIKELQQSGIDINTYKKQLNLKINSLNEALRKTAQAKNSISFETIKNFHEEVRGFADEQRNIMRNFPQEYLSAIDNQYDKVFKSEIFPSNKPVGLDSVVTGLDSFRKYAKESGNIDLVKRIDQTQNLTKVWQAMKEATDQGFEIGGRDFNNFVMKTLDPKTDAFDLYIQNPDMFDVMPSMGAEQTVIRNIQNSLGLEGRDFVAFKEMIRDPYRQSVLEQLKEVSPELAEHLSRADELYQQFQNSGLPEKIKESKDITQFVIDNYGEIIKYAPEANTAISNMILDRILEKSRTKDGNFNLFRLKNSLEKYRDKLMPDELQLLEERITDIEATTKQYQSAIEQIKQEKEGVRFKAVEDIINMKEQKEALAEQIKILDEQRKAIGTDSKQVMDNIGSLKTLDDLNQLTELTGIDATQIGKIYAKSVMEAFDAELSKFDDEGLSPKNLSKIYKELDKPGRGSPEQLQLQEALYGKEGKNFIQEFKKNADKIEELNKIDGSSGTVRVAKLLLAITLKSMGFVLAPVSLFMEATLPVKRTGSKDIPRRSPQTRAFEAEEQAKAQASREKNINRMKTVQGIGATLSGAESEPDSIIRQISQPVEEEKKPLELMFQSISEEQLASDLLNDEAPEWFINDMKIMGRDADQKAWEEFKQQVQ